MKIAMLFPYAPSYREAIYKLMDKEFDIDWYFCGNAKRNLRLLDYNILNRCNLELRERKVYGRITYYQGVSQLPFYNYDAIIMTGVTRCLSEWKVALKYGNKKHKPKVYLWAHGWYGREKNWQKKLKKILFHFCDGLLLYGDYAKQEMLKEGFNPAKLHVIHNSLDYTKQLEVRQNLRSSYIYSHHFGNNNPTLLFIGRLTPEKKLDMLINAVAILKDKGENYNLVLVGDGQMRQVLQNRAIELGISKQVWFYGECYEESVNAELIFNADLCVSPGNIGLTAVHSLMFGCPAITHDDFRWQGPEFEVIKNNKTGNFFERDNQASLKECISTWFLTHKNDRDVIRRNCFQEIDNGWNPQFQINVLKDLLNVSSTSTRKL